MRPYQYCSKEECAERQKMGQVSELEATLETCHLPQAKRKLDPEIAVSKYRRSAAGSDDDGRPIRNKTDLTRTLNHLVRICSTLQASDDHPALESIDTVITFVVDRLRACQSDAIRLMSNSKTSISSSWHARVIRVLIWLRYACYGSSTDNKDAIANADATARTIDHMRSTAYDAYWNTVTGTQHAFQVGDHANKYCEDDEMLFYEAIIRMCATSEHTVANYGTSLERSWNSMLVEFWKRRRPGTAYPLWDLALRIASHVQREEYYVLWNPDYSFPNELPILAKCIMSSEALLLWRYRTVQHYNKSFGKGESVPDMNTLLGIDTGWSVEYANVFGVPVEEITNKDDNQTIMMKLKQVVMEDWSSKNVDQKTILSIRKSDRHWMFGDCFTDVNENPLGMSPEAIRSLLKFGHVPPFDDDKNENNDQYAQPTSSLARALAANKGNDKSSKTSSSLSRAILTNGRNGEYGKTSSLSRAVRTNGKNGQSGKASSLSRAKGTGSTEDQPTKTSSLSRAVGTHSINDQPAKTSSLSRAVGTNNRNDQSEKISSLSQAVGTQSRDDQPAKTSSLSRAVGTQSTDNQPAKASSLSRAVGTQSTDNQPAKASSLSLAVGTQSTNDQPSKISSLSRAVGTQSIDDQSVKTSSLSLAVGTNSRDDQPTKTSSLSLAVDANSRDDQPSQKSPSLSQAAHTYGLSNEIQSTDSESNAIERPQKRSSPLQTAIHRASRANNNNNNGNGSSHSRSGQRKQGSSSLARALASSGNSIQPVKGSSLSRAVAVSRSNNGSSNGSSHSRSGQRKQSSSSLARALAASETNDQSSSSLSRAVAASRVNNNSNSGSSHSRSGQRKQSSSSLARALAASGNNDQPSSSLSRVAAASRANNSSTNGSTHSRSRPRQSSLQAAVRREKATKTKRICRFYNTAQGCRFGDRCKFEHTA